MKCKSFSITYIITIFIIIMGVIPIVIIFAIKPGPYIFRQGIRGEYLGLLF